MHLNRDQIKAVLILIVAGLLLVGGAFIYLKQREFLVDADLCPIHQDISGHTIFVVDRSDALSADLKSILVDKVHLEVSRIGLFERFTIYSLDRERTSYPRLLFSKCNPGNRNTSNVAFQTPERLQKRYEAEFLNPLLEIVGQLDPENITPETPLLNFLSSVPDLKDFSSNVPKRRLIVFSDMVQNSRRYSQIDPKIGGFSSENYLDPIVVLGRLFPGGEEPTYDGIDVLVYQYEPKDRESISRQSEKHRAFWRDFLKLLGAQSYELQLI